MKNKRIIKDVATIRRLAKEGKVRVRSGAEKAAAGMMKTIRGDTKPDFTITRVRISECWGKWMAGKVGNDGGFEVDWQTVSAGFGTLTFFMKNGKLHCDSEGTGKKFIQKVMNKVFETVSVCRSK